MSLDALPLDVGRIRKDFPILDREVRPGVPLVYLDNAATSQKPTQVLDAMRDYYERHNANVHRGIHTLAEEATALYEGARDKVASFINAASSSEVVFTKNSTEALNLLAHVLPFGPGGEVVVTEMEHHSNLVPWQLACQRTGATLKWIGLTDDGRLDLADLDRVITARTKVVSFVHQSNLLGTVNPVDVVVAKARSVGALVVLDCSQSVPHMGVDVQSLGVDAIAFTSHKMLGPTGIGVLWAPLARLEEWPPFLGGGEMIDEVTMAGSTWAVPPHKYEAGTPPIAEAVGLGAAVDYLTDIGMDVVHEHELQLTAYALDALQGIDGLRIIGPTTTDDRGGAISFALDGIHPHDVGQLLDEHGVAVRVGHHCARPACLRYGVPATTRASVHLYSSTDDIDRLVEGLTRVKAFFTS
jgi:cysteine desulfurase/selenocysteine lyase